MAKTSKAAKKSNSKANKSSGAARPAAQTRGVNVPHIPEIDGYDEQDTGDLVGFWDPTMTAIHCIPIGFTLSDSQLEPQKPSVLFIVELLDAIDVVKGKVGEQEVISADAGERVGIWGKPGMRAILNQCGVPTLLALTGEKDIGKPSAMLTFACKAKQRGTRLPLLDDHRDKSAHASCFALPKQRGNSARSAAPVDYSDVPIT